MIPTNSSSKHVFPEGTFVTCSADNTIRFWNVHAASSAPATLRNVFSKELLRVLYFGSDFTHMKALNSEPQVNSEIGIRCIKVSPDGVHLASGDRQGNLSVHDLQSLAAVHFGEVHDAEILSLDYSRKNPTGSDVTAYIR